jgi:hypothetical protein
MSTEVSGQGFGPIFKGQQVLFFLDFMTLEDEPDTLSRNVGNYNYHTTLRDIAEDSRFHQHRGGSLKLQHRR